MYPVPCIFPLLRHHDLKSSSANEFIHLDFFFTYALREVAWLRLGATAEGAKAATEVARRAPMARENFIFHKLIFEEI